MKRAIGLVPTALIIAACYKAPPGLPVDAGTDGRTQNADVAVTSGDGPSNQADTGAEQVDGISVVVTEKQGDGKACGRDGDCQSGFCQDGVCCHEACAGACRACAESYTGLPDGTCGNALAGSSPRGGCPNETANNACGHDGTCDGAGQCRNVTVGQPCAPASCADMHTFQPGGTCDGTGTCVSPAKMDCGSFQCATTGCAKPCAVASDCPAPQYCANGTCKVAKALGVTCTAANECTSGFCSPDHVCCDKACSGVCNACVKASTGQPDGTCGPVQLGQDPHDDCAVEPSASCGKDGACDGKGACHLYASGTSCSAGSCSGSTFTPAKTCSGAGMCLASGSTMDCGQSSCAADGCKGSCTTDADCVASSYCDKAGPKCTAKKSNGTACSAGNQCTSGACVEGICCNSACTGTCVSCSSAKTGAASGTCTFIKAGTVDSRCTASDKSTCGQDGNCDGAGQCEKWPSSTTCAPGTCSNGAYLAPRTCNQGICNPAAQTACGGAVCDATSGCRTTCSGPSDCTGNNYCDPATKRCTPLKGNGGACGDKSQCLSGFCVDNVCCNAKCDGQCQSCSTGTCANTTTSRTACGGSGACAGTCNGSSPGCVFPGSGTACSSASCKDSQTVQLAGTCNGSGSCAAGATQACPSGKLCSGAGSCGCSSGTSDCGAAGCINVNGSDGNHCGSCTTVCSSGQTCVSGKCLLGDGQPCTLATQCASHACNLFYQDIDGDGYGAGPAVGFCGTATPVGYAQQNGDCCDNGTNLAVAKLIHPGADFQTTSAGGICGITWDYDCSGAVESSPQMIASCGEWPTCTATIASYAESSCGTSEDATCGCTGAGGGCFSVCSGHPAVPIRCK